MSHSLNGEKKRWKIHLIGILPVIHKEEAVHDPGEIIRAQDTGNTEIEIEVGLSNRAIARACCISNSTVGDYVMRAGRAGVV